jgi:SAM-dependent methyltransferase/MoaA/NifB/PqqE/SkfB family radical SAM enzyme
VDVRAAMARGEKPASCAACWHREAQGGVSRRLLMNAGYREFAGQAIEKLPDIGAATGYRLEERPSHFVLEMGNVCNLKCRSCCGICSSRIAADGVHAAWNGGDTPRSDVIRVNGARWFEDIGAMATMLESAEGDIALTLMGGEPFLIPSVWKLLSELVARGVSQRVYVGLSSNGQQTDPRLEELVPQYRGFNVSVSVDGYGKLYEYLRHGAEWDKLVRSLDWMRRIPRLDVCVVPTLQNCNALGMVDLLRFLDDRGIRVMYNVVNDPARLAHTCLPSSIRRIAERRLRNYLDHECKPENVSVVRAYCHALEPSNDAFDADRFQEFMEFTNDLDASRGERFREAAPELWTLLRAAGVDWSDAHRHVPPSSDASVIASEVLERVNRTIADKDLIFPGFEAIVEGAYFTSAAQQVAAIDKMLRANGHPGLKECTAVADVGSHYGRITRALRAALPKAAVYACDIDPDAVRFCADELGALPVSIGWRPDGDVLPADLGAIVCFSLLTHTPLHHWRASLRAWARMLRPGGVAAFTYLADHRLVAWRAGEMNHYGAFTEAAKDDVERSLLDTGFGFAPLTSGYGGEPFYGITFATPDVVVREIEAAGLEVLVVPPESPDFGQEVALFRKPQAADDVPAPVPVATRDVRVVALYDPSGYAAEGGPDPGASMWMRLVASESLRPLPTELGFTDARVAEVRDAQASLAAEHGVDAFCYLYRWNGGPLWDEPLRKLLDDARSAFPFCLMLDVEGPEPIGVAESERLFAEVLRALPDRRYLRVDDRPLIAVKNAARLAEPRASAAAWRQAAISAGVGELHLCAVEPITADRPEHLGFDSCVMASHKPERARHAAHAMAASWPPYRAFRMVQCFRDPGESEALEVYEYWLQSAVAATRARAESVVFLDAWNDWSGGKYLEPDDRAGRTVLQATRRAVRGPASGLVLLRRLQDALASGDAETPAVVAELESVMQAHERGRDRLFALVEAALIRNEFPRDTVFRRLPVPIRHLPPSDGRAMIDYLDGVGGVPLHTGAVQVRLRGDEALIAGWAHCGSAPELVDLFVAFESDGANDDAAFPISKRVPRPDVSASNAGYPEHCGFQVTIPLRDVAPGTYRVSVLQRTPHATYRDTTAVVVIREDPSCSSG